MVPCDRLGFPMDRTPFLLAHRLTLDETVNDIEYAITSCSECKLTVAHVPNKWHLISISYRSWNCPKFEAKVVTRLPQSP